jgi:hypothetical protein
MFSDKIYLLIEREFIISNQTVYKIGKTTQENFKRFNAYPKDSQLLFYRVCQFCNNEKKIIKLFKTKYKQRTDFGTEYFEGNFQQMIKDINNIIDNECEQSIVIVDHEHEQCFKLVVNNCEQSIVIEDDEKMFCKKCQYKTCFKRDYEKHLLTTKHIMKQNETECSPINNSKKYCKSCDYVTSVKSSFDKHLLTAKHIMKQNVKQNVTESCICGKVFNNRTSLWRHKKQCITISKLKNVVTNVM